MSGAAGESGAGSSLDLFVEAYESAQARDGRAELADYLPAPDHPLYSAVLCELVRVDLEYAWTRGRPRRVEDYQAAFPALARDREALRLVAFEEWRLRHQAGERPDPEEYRERLGVDILDGHSAPPGTGRPEADPATSRGGDDGEADVTADVRRAPDAHAELLRSLREADPPTADRVACALSSLPEPGETFAGFRLIRELGRGAFGRVYLARQGDLADRLVALKVAAELHGETRTLAQLQHTHIVPIYSAHRVGPLRAVCMPYFGATTLADVLRQLRDRGAPPDPCAALVAALEARRAEAGPDALTAHAEATAGAQEFRRLGPVRAVLWIGARLAEGLAHARERGIVHRDLKPANVLLTNEGRPMLLDFNLAADTKRRGAAIALVGGTLPYMAPEALAALRDGPRPVDPSGDLYALGLILFELLTGRHPFPIHRGAVDAILARMIADRGGPPPRLRPANPAVSPAVEAIVRRCLEPDASKRYREARHLAEDLQRQLDDRPLRHTREPSLRERAGKWTRRHPRLSSAAGIGAVAALLIAGLVSLYAERQRQFGPVAAAHAFRQLADDHEEALVLLLDPAADPARIAAGIATCRRALDRYAALADPSWPARPLVRNLPPGDRDTLRARVGELLLLLARAVSRQVAGAEDPRRAELVRAALDHNARAAATFAPGTVPRAVWDQREALARLAGDEAQARRARDQAARVPVRSPRDFVLLAAEDFDRLPARDTLPALAEASRRDPRDFALWMCLGACYARRARLDEAEDCFTIAIILRPQSPWPYLQRGLAELGRREFSQAFLDFDRVLALRPDLTSARVNRALARSGLGDDRGAVADLTAALDRGTPETRIYFIRSQARARLSDRRGAARDRAEGLRRTPADEESWIARGLARLPDDPQGALADLTAALALNPQSRSALQNQASVLSEALGRTEEAVAVLDRLLALDPDDVPARVGRGVLLARLGRRAEAHRDAEEAQRRDRSGATAYRVACIYALTSRAEPADRPLALRRLAEALGSESDWAPVARTDPDLNPLHDQAEFHDLLRAYSGRPGPET